MLTDSRKYHGVRGEGESPEMVKIVFRKGTGLPGIVTIKEICVEGDDRECSCDIRDHQPLKSPVYVLTICRDIQGKACACSRNEEEERHDQHMRKSKKDHESHAASLVVTVHVNRIDEKRTVIIKYHQHRPHPEPIHVVLSFLLHFHPVVPFCVCAEEHAPVHYRLG